MKSEGVWAELWQKNCLLNPKQNIWKKVEKFSKFGQDMKSLVSAFVHFFNCYCQSLIYGRETGH